MREVVGRDAPYPGGRTEVAYAVLAFGQHSELGRIGTPCRAAHIRLDRRRRQPGGRDIHDVEPLAVRIVVCPVRIGFGVLLLLLARRLRIVNHQCDGLAVG